MAELIRLARLDGTLLFKQDKILFTDRSTGSERGFTFVLLVRPSITWFKGLELTHPDLGVIAGAYTQDNHRGPVSFTIPSPPTQFDLYRTRVLLSKAKAAGVHTGMYEIRVDDFPLAPNGATFQIEWIQD